MVEYCEKKLGMVRLDGENFEVLAVNKGAAEPIAPVALTETQDAMPSAYRYTYRQTNENLGQ